MAYDAYLNADAAKKTLSTETAPTTAAAQWLAYLAAAPLIAAALAIVASDNYTPFAAYFMSLYGAALIVFFGGVRWGVAIMKEGGPTMPALAGACLPLVAAIPLLAFPSSALWKFPVIMGVMALLLADDLNATRRGSGAPRWYLAVRLPLTVLIELAFVVAIVGMVR